MAVCWSNYKSNFLNNNGMEYTLRQKDTAEFFISYNNIMKFWNGKFPEKIPFEQSQGQPQNVKPTQPLNEDVPF